VSEDSKKMKTSVVKCELCLAFLPTAIDSLDYLPMVVCN